MLKVKKKLKLNKNFINENLKLKKKTFNYIQNVEWIVISVPEFKYLI